MKTFATISLIFLTLNLFAQNKQIKESPSDEGTITLRQTDSIADPVTATCDVQVPNAFSPNGDNENDILYVRDFKASQIYFTIYNRWGQEVFHSESLEDGWDGRYKGQDLNSGVFVYYLRGTCVDMTKVERTGSVTLIR